MKKIFTLLFVLSLLLLTLVGCGSSKKDVEDTKIITIGATAFPHVEILKIAEPILKEKGYTLKIEEFGDYPLINAALNDKNLDANFFQHEPYLDTEIANKGYEIVSIGKVHVEPMGVYSKNIKNLDELKDGDSISIPNDESNGGRALLLLAKYNVITLKEGVSLPSVKDITSNPKNIKFVEVDAAYLPTTVDDPKIVASVINTNFALTANLNPIKDAIVMEDKSSPYANIIVVRTENKDKPFAKALVEALNSDEVRKYIENDLADQGIIPAF